MTISAQVYIARHERAEAAEAYAKRLSPEQIDYMLKIDGDYWMTIHPNGKVSLDLIEDEG